MRESTPLSPFLTVMDDRLYCNYRKWGRGGRGEKGGGIMLHDGTPPQLTMLSHD